MTSTHEDEPKSGAADPALTAEELRKIDAYWRACNYLCAGMIYLHDNPLLRAPLRPKHFKNRLLGHWGSDPGQTFTWVHLNRVIRKYDLDMIYISGPGHGAPAVISNCYLEGTYSEIYPEKSQDEGGLLKLFRAFSFPGQLGSHCTPEVPGSIHEGGELGYSLSHAFGAAFDNPDLIVSVVVGDGEAETGPLATSWHSNKFLNPIRDGAVLPILHLNGYKIANPTLLARISPEELGDLFKGYGWTPHVVEGDDPELMHQQMAATVEDCVQRIHSVQQEARRTGKPERPRWPMIILRTPKGWTGPKQVDGHKVEGFWRAHQVPVLDVQSNPEHLRIVEQWMRSYRPEELFDQQGALVPELREQDKPVIFNFHGYPWLIHKFTYRRTNPANIHLRGYKEKGNINTPLELAIRNQVDRFNLAIDVIDRVAKLPGPGAQLKEWLKGQIIESINYADTEGLDKPEIRNWKWPSAPQDSSTLQGTL